MANTSATVFKIPINDHYHSFLGRLCENFPGKVYAKRTSENTAYVAIKDTPRTKYLTMETLHQKFDRNPEELISTVFFSGYAVKTGFFNEGNYKITHETTSFSDITSASCHFNVVSSNMYESNYFPANEDTVFLTEHDYVHVDDMDIVFNETIIKTISEHNKVAENKRR